MLPRALFSDRALELTFEDMAAREADFHRYKSRSLDRLRTKGVYIASLIVFGVLCCGLVLLRDVMNNMHAKVRAIHTQSTATHPNYPSEEDVFA
ncbi:LysM peptidoglycan-binding domain-containing protein [Babesia caballi]|uniref:LysM peptidoglycan-binding domain-containing protein n=1 Tax=Babesia caballi TaxID=5871 RepID=A0AAV4LVH5_BABCB|nr:LysM peptidoglycan-binding domain-containing protein [Babesia caballi]